MPTLYDNFGAARLPHIYTTCSTTDEAIEEAILQYGQEYLQKIAAGIMAASKTGSTSFTLTFSTTNGANSNIKNAVDTIRQLFKTLSTNANNAYKTYTYTAKGTNTKNETKTYDVNTKVPDNITLTAVEIKWDEALADFQNGSNNFTQPIVFKLYYKDSNNNYQELKSSASEMFEIKDKATVEIKLGFPDLGSSIKNDHSVKLYYSTTEDQPVTIQENVTDEYNIYNITGKYIEKTDENDKDTLRNRFIITFINEDGIKVQLYLKITKGEESNDT